MSRSGYSEDYDYGDGHQNQADLYRNAVERALYGKRGQAFLREMLAALDAMPEKRLIESALVCSRGVCAMGAVARARRLDTSDVDVEDRYEVGALLGIAPAMAAEIAFENDDDFGDYRFNSPEDRWKHMRDWCARHIKPQQEQP